MQIKVGVIGLGYWGPNYVRNFINNGNSEVIWACDVSQEALNSIKKIYPHLKLTKDYKELLKDQSINCIAIATPPQTHFEITKNALESGKHVLVAKPMATDLQKAHKLLAFAQENNLLLHGDLTYLYTDAIKLIKDQLQRGIIGNPLYYDSTRTNLGLLQKDVNVVWDLVPHDLAIIDFLLGFKALKIFASAFKHHKNSASEEMAHIIITYEKNFVAHIHVSWLSPVKIRTILIGGDKKMIYFDDLQPDEKVKIYDKGISFSLESVTPFKPVYRSGEIVIPKLKQDEALSVEVTGVVKQIMRKEKDYSNAKLNIKILKILEACDQSIKSGHSVNI